ncbi:MAG: MaoC family dehydratase [Pseudomonadota bacterium]
MDIDSYIASAGSLAKTSPWVEIGQNRINVFADATEDHQFIHVDEARANSETPFGGTIAHGFLSLSLLSHFFEKCMPRINGTVMGINYGFEKVRFLMPVPSAARLRGHFKLLECTKRNPGEYLSKLEVSIEIEDQEKPALVAEWLVLAIIQEQEDE